MSRTVTPALTAAAVVALAAAPGAHAIVVPFSAPSGLGAEAEFTLLNPTTLVLRLRNTSTGVPGGFDSSDQILTGIAWDFGAAGINAGDPTITGGNVAVGPGSASVNFDVSNVGAGGNVGGEWGFGNAGTTGFQPNFISAIAAGATAFGGPNLDGPAGLNGPEAGLVASPPLVPLGGLGAIQNEIVATLTLSGPVADLSFLTRNPVTVEFGSDAAFIVIPAPGAGAAMAAALLAAARRRRRG